MAPTQTNPINTVTLNGKRGKPKLVKPFVHAVNTDAIRVEKAGFLFKAALDDDHLALGVTPYFIAGQRTWHYDLVMPDEIRFCLLGSINADGHFTILFEPGEHFTPEAKSTYAECYIRFAQFLFAWGLEGDGPFDEITVQFLSEAGLFASAPVSLAELAALVLAAE
ncbi:MAG: hypothetical protein HN909_09035 [Phycisphaerales bacterium]|jgi:hypothetical protein|nr:hypothetical protein [Phycisphaerales bacterium]MBT7171895.1 hypothetical protein [Phycisphaerales bacterium]